MSLRSYQHDVITKLQAAVANGARRVLLVAPTGSGKTVVAGVLIKAAERDFHRSLFIAHRRELIDQTHRRLKREGITASVILAGREGQYDALSRTQVAGIQSLIARIKSKRVSNPNADLLIIDEAHHSRAETYQKLMDAYPDAIIVGLTATPCRGDGRGLGKIFDEMVECPAIPELIRQGHLVPSVCYSHPTADLKGVKSSITGDWQTGELAERMNTDKLVGDIVTHWNRLAEGRKTVVFAVDVAHSKHIANEFIASGIKTGHIDGGTPIAEREETLAKLSAGDITVVSNCMVLTEGWDQPDVACCVLARPTKSLGLHLQMVGRVLRPFPGKDHALILDHAGNVVRHGLPEDEIFWTLNPDDRALNMSQAARNRVKARGEAVMCPECKPREVPLVTGCCPVCDWRPNSKAQAVEFVDGDLARLDGNGRPNSAPWSPAARHNFHGQLAWIARERRYKPGWVFHKFKEKFGTNPPYGTPALVQPEPATLSWVRSRQIAFSKARERVVPDRAPSNSWRSASRQEIPGIGTVVDDLP